MKLEQGKGGKESEEYNQSVLRMKKYFLDTFIGSLNFLFVELGSCQYISQFKQLDLDVIITDKVNLSIFEYFDLISELFLVSMIDIYGLLSKGLSNIKLLSQNPKPDYKIIQSHLNKEVFQQNLDKLVEMGFEAQKAKNALIIN